MKFLKKFNSWFNGCYDDTGWVGVVFKLLLILLFDLLLYWSPEIHSWLTGKEIVDFITPEQHRWHMTIAYNLTAVYLFFAIVKAIQLIKYRGRYSSQHDKKKLADKNMEAEISARKQKK